MNRICGFCKKTCTEPKFLPCSHGFCKVCLNFQIIKVPTNRQWEGFSCPFCKTYTKAIDPDEPLQLWVEQFPNKPYLPRKASEPMLHSTNRRMSSAEDAFSRMESSLRVPPTSDLMQDFTLPVSDSSEAQGTSPRLSTSSSVSEPQMSPLPKTLSSFSSGTSSVSDKEPCKLFSVSESVDSQDGADVFTTPDDTDTIIIDAESDPPVEDSAENDEQMCMVHPWKPVLIKCSRCGTVACGLCLTESHIACSGKDFSPLGGSSLVPDVSELMEEVEKVNSVNEMITSSSERLQNMGTTLHEKIRQVTRQMIKDIRSEEQQMIKKIQHLYRKETHRLKSGIAPSHVLLTGVQQLKKHTEELATHHFTDILQNSDALMDKQKTLMDDLKAIDVTCIPPEVDFVRKWDAIYINLGDVIVDHGLYPKHDINDINVPETHESQVVHPTVEPVHNINTEVQHGKVPNTSTAPHIPEVSYTAFASLQRRSGDDIDRQIPSQAVAPTHPDQRLPTARRPHPPGSSSKPAPPTAGASASQPGPKFKSHTLMSRLFSPKQNQKPEKPNPKQEKGKSKFYLKKT